MNSPDLLPAIPSKLRELSAVALEWPRLRDHIAGRTFSPLGRAWILALDPSADLAWIDQQQQRTAEVRSMLARGGSFEFGGLFDATILLEKSRIDGAALESTEIRDLLAVVERIAAWCNLIKPAPNGTRYEWPSIVELSSARTLTRGCGTRTHHWSAAPNPRNNFRTKGSSPSARSEAHHAAIEDAAAGNRAQRLL